MATHLRGHIVQSLLWLSAACFGLQACSSAPEENPASLEVSSEDEAAEVDYDAEAAGSDEGATADPQADVTAIGDGLAVGSLLSDNGLAMASEPVDPAAAGQGLAADAVLGTDSVLAADHAASASALAEVQAPQKSAKSSKRAPAAEEMAAAANAETFQYKVLGGDWLSKIAGKVYGDIYKWPVIASANPQISNPNRIFPGDVINVPITGDSSKAFAAQYNGTARVEPKAAVGSHLSSVTVKKGDTLSAIAKRLLGSASAWTKLWEQNKASVSNPHALQPGQTLTLDLSGVVARLDLAAR